MQCIYSITLLFATIYYYLYYHETVIVALDVRIESYHARFSKQLYGLRSVRNRDSTCADETGSG